MHTILIFCLLLDGNDLDLLSLRDGNDPVWRQLLDYERLLCYCSGKLIRKAYMTGMCVSTA